ncbi:hypothetical protein ACET67_20310, partial [Aeromonas veronii]
VSSTRVRCSINVIARASCMETRLDHRRSACSNFINKVRSRPEPANEPPEKGEVIWRDEAGVTCRRWNWRQGVRTRLDEHAKKMWFILESLPEMPREALQAASDDLISGLKKMMPEAQIVFTYVEDKE